MFSKKLLTLVCVVGILAFGACIPIPTHGPPPAPPALPLQGIHVIQVAATNGSESRHIDPGGLTQALVNTINFNARTANTGLKANVLKQGEAGDALLKITLLSESATPPPGGSSNGNAKWALVIKISASLTKKDGEVVWTETGADYPLTPAYPREDPDDVWKEPTLPHWLEVNLSSSLVNRMLDAK